MPWTSLTFTSKPFPSSNPRRGGQGGAGGEGALRYHLPPSLRPAEICEAPLQPGDGRSHADGGIHSSQRRHRAQRVAADIPQDGEIAEIASVNRVEPGKDRKMGIITSSTSYQYVKEACGDTYPVLKLGMVWPLGGCGSGPRGYTSS